jgi:hypothetical protein
MLPATTTMLSVDPTSEARKVSLDSSRPRRRRRRAGLFRAAPRRPLPPLPPPPTHQISILRAHAGLSHEPLAANTSTCICRRRGEVARRCGRHHRLLPGGAIRADLRAQIVIAGGAVSWPEKLVWNSIEAVSPAAFMLNFLTPAPLWLNRIASLETASLLVASAVALAAERGTLEKVPASTHDSR